MEIISSEGFLLLAWRLLGTYREIPFDGADRGARGESLEIEVGGGGRSGFGDGEGWGGEAVQNSSLGWCEDQSNQSCAVVGKIERSAPCNQRVRWMSNWEPMCDRRKCRTAVSRSRSRHEHSTTSTLLEPGTVTSIASVCFIHVRAPSERHHQSSTTYLLRDDVGLSSRSAVSGNTKGGESAREG